MSESIAYMSGLKDIRKAMRAAFGKPCPMCVKLLPKAHPSILLPGDTCRIHRHKDSREQPTDAQINEALKATGYEVS